MNEEENETNKGKDREREKKEEIKEKWVMTGKRVERM